MFVFLGSVILLLIGSFLPWAKLGPIGVSGMEGDGVITLVLSIIAIIIYFILKKKPMIVKISTIIIGILSAIIAFVTVVNISEVPFGSVGSGVIVTIIGGIGLTVSAFLKRQ